jgi:hypothetical protein
MFQARQDTELLPLIEISFVALTPGAVANATTVGVAAAACKLGSATSTSNATFALGDRLDVFPSAAAAINGVTVTASPTATAGTATINFTNATGGSVTPVAGAVYKIVATRSPNTLVS